MKEELLHLVWRNRLLNYFHSYTTDGDRIEVIFPGYYNGANAGPDFSSSKIRINGTLWVGSVEIHYHTSDWYQHLHHFDPAYQNVILHVVFEDDCGFVEGTKRYPILELKRCVDASVWNRLDDIEKKEGLKPCWPYLKDVPVLEWINWKDRLLVERFEVKNQDVEQLYHLSNKNWDSVCLQLLMKSLGGVVNKEPFQILSKEIPMDIIYKNKNKLVSIEAIVFGMAGLLEGEFRDLYPNHLKSEYQFYKSKYGLYQMKSFWWRWLRLRPTAFPTIQLAMVSSLLFKLKSLEELFSQNGFKDFHKMLQENSCLTAYWENHYKFDFPTKEKTKNWGRDMARRIYINGVVPYQIFKQKQMGSEDVSEVINSMLKINKEDNKIIRNWEALGVRIKSSYESQALLQLENHYCSQKKCLNCNIGLRILKQSKSDKSCKKNT